MARVSGPQRSTVSLIIEELIADRLVVEGPTGRLPRGRRPTFLQLNSQRAVLALDIHPDQITLAISDLGGKILAQKLVDIPESTRSVAAIVSAIKKMISEHKQKAFDGIGVCLPGRTDPVLEDPIFAPHEAHRTEPGGLLVNPQDAQTTGLATAIGYTVPPRPGHRQVGTTAWARCRAMM